MSSLLADDAGAVEVFEEVTHRFKGAVPMEVDEDGPPSHLVKLISKQVTAENAPRLGLSKKKHVPVVVPQAVVEPKEGLLENNGDDSCLITIILLLRDCKTLRRALERRSSEIKRIADGGALREQIVYESMRLVFSLQQESVDDLRNLLGMAITAFSQHAGEISVVEVSCKSFCWFPAQIVLLSRHWLGYWRCTQRTRVQTSASTRLSALTVSTIVLARESRWKVMFASGTCT